MENETNIGSLVNEIEGQIEEKIQTLQTDYQLQRSILIEGFKSEAQQETHVYLEQELADLRTSVLQSESQSKWKVKKDMFVRRNELVDGLFEDAIKQLKAFSQTKAYDALCLKNLDDVLATQAQDASFILYVKPVDQPLFERLCKAKSCSLQVISQENIFVGGFVLSNPSLNIDIDKTLDYQVRLQKEWFYAHSGLDF